MTNKENNGCCEQCKEYREAPDGGGSYYACVNPSCKCHQEAVEGDSYKFEAYNHRDKKCSKKDCSRKPSLGRDTCYIHLFPNHSKRSVPTPPKTTFQDIMKMPGSEAVKAFMRGGSDYERNHSHEHCWEQQTNSLTPACGQLLENHTQCCLCDTPIPTERNILDRPYCTCDKPEFSNGGWAVGVMKCDNCGDLMPPKTNTMEDWEPEIERLLREYAHLHGVPNSIKDFVKELLVSQREEERKRVLAEQNLRVVELLHKYAMQTEDTKTLDLIEAIQEEVLSLLSDTQLEDKKEV